jgi:hypothetical protein
VLCYENMSWNILHHNILPSRGQLLRTTSTSTRPTLFTLLDLRPRCNLSDTVAFDPLRTLIVEQLHTIHAERESTCRLFSASHLSAFWFLESDSPNFDVAQTDSRKPSQAEEDISESTYEAPSRSKESLAKAWPQEYPQPLGCEQIERSPEFQCVNEPQESVSG